MRKRERFHVEIFQSIDQLPPLIAAEVRRHRPDVQPAYIVVIPPQEYPVFRRSRFFNLPFGWRKTPDRALVFDAAAILIVETDRAGSVTSRLVPLDRLLACTLSTVLLYGWMALDWVGDNGTLETLTIEFNAVAEPALRKALDGVKTAVVCDEPPRASARAKTPTARIETFPLKFRNYLRFALLPGEQVIAAIYQPARFRQRGPWKTIAAPGCVIALTDRHVIVLAEAGRGIPDYSMTTRHFPLKRLVQVDVESGADEPCLRLGLGLETAVDEVCLPLRSSDEAFLLSAVLRDAGLVSPEMQTEGVRAG